MNKKKLLATFAAVTAGAMLFTACASPQTPAPSAAPAETPQPTATAPRQTPSVQPTATEVPAASAIVPPEPIGTPDSNPGPAAIPDNKTMTMKYVGTYDGVTDEYGEEQLYLKNLNGDDDPSADLLATPSETTAIIDAQTGAKLSVDDLKKGDMAVAYTSPQMTRSIPPQAPVLYALVTNIPEGGAAIPEYIEIAQSTESQGEYTIENENHDLILTVLPETAESMTVFGSGETAPGSALKQGAKIFAWVGAVALSYPAQATADKVMVIE